MVRTLFTAAFMVAAFSLVVAVPADAASLEPKNTKSAGAKSARVKSASVDQGSGGHPQSRYYRGGPRVKGFVARRGGYSYTALDIVNTYGDSRSNFGGASSYRDPSLDRQSSSGPFDHGFFFDSGISPRGGNSPYRN